MKAESFVKKYQGKTLQDDGPVKSQDFIRFARDFRGVVKDCAATIGANLKKFSVGHYFVSGFLEKDEKYVYFYYSEPRCMAIDLLRRDPMMGILVRTADGPTDFRGGRNNFCNIMEFAYTAANLLPA